MSTLTPDVIGSIFTGALIEVISKITSFSLDVLSIEQDADFNEIVSVMNLNSKMSGTVFLSAEEADMRILCSYMTGVHKDAITKEDMWDALCEIVNMTAGNAKVRLGGTDYFFELTTPYAISGKNMSIIVKKRSTIISRTFGNGTVSIKMKIVY